MMYRSIVYQQKRQPSRGGCRRSVARLHRLRAGHDESEALVQTLAKMLGDDFFLDLRRYHQGRRLRQGRYDFRVTERSFFVLRGAEQLLTRRRPTSLLEAGDSCRNFGYEPQQVFDWLQERGWSCQSLGGDCKRPGEEPWQASPNYLFTLTRCSASAQVGITERRRHTRGLCPP